MNSMMLALALMGGGTAVTQPSFPQPLDTPQLVPQTVPDSIPQPLPPAAALPPPPSFYPPAVPFVPAPSVTVYPEPMTIEEFAKVFKPCPGKYEVCLRHPRTCEPTKVCFTLPDCPCPPKVDYGRRFIEFDYGKQEVEIRFKLFHHTPTVEYND